MIHIVLAQNNQNGLVGIYPNQYSHICYRYSVRLGPASYVHVCHKCTEMSEIYNVLSDVCVSSMDLFESLKLPPFGIGDRLYFI